MAGASNGSISSLVSCNQGTLLSLRPGQAHNFGRDENWDGWIVLFRSEFLRPTLSQSYDLKLAFDFERLPDILRLDSDEFCRVSDSIARMREDSLIDAPSKVRPGAVALSILRARDVAWLHACSTKGTRPVVFS